MPPLPRVQLAALPTPLTPATRLSEELGIEIWLKRDDLTGFGLGGNKVRSLEYHIGAAKAEEADVLITGGGPDSNWVMLACLTAVTHGMSARVIYYGHEVSPRGNLALVSTLPGVEFSFTGKTDRTSVDVELEALSSSLHAAGVKPYLIGRGGASGVGALGYVDAMKEIDNQAERAGLHDYTLWLPAGSCGTLAGLVAGRALGGQSRQLVGVSVSRPVSECVTRVEGIASEALDLLRHPASLDRVSWAVHGGHNRTYGKASLAGIAAARLMASAEGVFLDPIFGAKAFAGLIDAVSAGTVNGPLVFLTSGGAPTLFAAVEQ